MSIIERLNRRFWQFGGWRLLVEYVRLGVLGCLVREGWKVLHKKEDIGEAYARIQSEVIPYIRIKYAECLDNLIDKHANRKLNLGHSRVVWVCWLQGMENAPEIVKVCYASLKRYLTDREIVVISEKNIAEYVTFPEHVQRKFQKGIIPMAQYSDLLRLELLTRYGGTWIDATVLCTGMSTQKPQKLQEETGAIIKDYTDCFDADLFLFQHLKKGETRFLGISNWFITASSNQRVLLILRDLLYQYWKDYDCVVAYFIFHIFFTMIAEKMPKEIAKMPRKSNKLCFYLEHRLSDEYDEAWMKELTDRCCFHKLNGRLWKEAEGKSNTFLCKIRELYQ